MKIEENSFDINRVKKNDILRLGITDILNRKKIVYPITQDWYSLGGYSDMWREALYSALYYIEQGEEEKWVSYILENYKLWNMIIWSYGGKINYIVWITLQTISQQELLYIIDNYSLSKNTLNYIQNTLRGMLNDDRSYENAINYEYHIFYDLLFNQDMPIIKYNSLIFSSKDYYKEWLKNIYHGISVWKDKREEWEAYFCNEVIDLKRNMFTKIFLKKDPVSTTLLTANCISDVWYMEEYQTMKETEKDILKKIKFKLIKFMF